jgi:hypothetical protein
MPMRTVQPQVRNSFLHRNATINAKPKVAYRSTKVSNKKQGKEKLNICPWITRLKISELISFGKWMFQFSKLKWHFIITQNYLILLSQYGLKSPQPTYMYHKVSRQGSKKTLLTLKRMHQLSQTSKMCNKQW